MKIYVATAFENLHEARQVMKQCQALGHEITHDWTLESTEGLAPEEHAAFLAECGLADFKGVVQADCVVLVMPKAKGLSCFAEWGMAIGAGKPSIVLYPSRRPNGVFIQLPGVYTAESPAELGDRLNRLQQQLDNARLIA